MTGAFRQMSARLYISGIPDVANFLGSATRAYLPPTRQNMQVPLAPPSKCFLTCQTSRKVLSIFVIRLRQTGLDCAELPRLATISFTRTDNFMCRNTVPTLRVLQDWKRDVEGKLFPSSYQIQQLDLQGGEWRSIPTINRYPEPEQKELPFEDRSSS
jgi:hypothetical protein